MRDRAINVLQSKIFISYNFKTKKIIESKDKITGPPNVGVGNVWSFLVLSGLSIKFNLYPIIFAFENRAISINVVKNNKTI